MNNAKILLAVTGGIAAYKSLELIRLLVKQEATVRTILTRNGAKFVTPLSLETLSGNPVAMTMFGQRTQQNIEHIELGLWADVAVIAPATANFLGKLANGIADDLLSTVMLALSPQCPVVVAPAMNTRMWNSPAVQRNLATVQTDFGSRFIIAQPQEKLLACNEWGVGAMAEPETIATAIAGAYSSRK
jgi:phosphopantothenoylcysteine decarboxylase / phosphopantothenate---cysteine ligase